MSTSKITCPGDRLRMHIDEAWQLNYWTAQLNVTPEQLRAAVQRAGELVCDVKREIGKLRRHAAHSVKSPGARRVFIARGRALN